MKAKVGSRANEIIRLLEGKGELTVGNVKKAYRVLSKKAHPDSSGKDAGLFVKLQEQYLEALKIAADLEEEPSAPLKARYENDLSLILFGFEMMDSKNHRRYYEMALYLIEESAPALKGHFKKLYDLFRREKEGESGKLRGIFAGEAAAVSNSLYGNERMCRALFDSYSRELAGLISRFDADIRESALAFESWLASQLAGGRR